MGLGAKPEGLLVVPVARGQRHSPEGKRVGVWMPVQHRRRLTNRTPEPDRRDRRRSASRCPFLSRADRPSPEASRAKGCLALEGCSPVAGGVRGRSRAVASVERSSAHVVSNQRGRPILRAGGLAGVAHPGWAPRRRASRRRGPALTPRSDRIWLGIDDLSGQRYAIVGRAPQTSSNVARTRSRAVATGLPGVSLRTRRPALHRSGAIDCCHTTGFRGHASPAGLPTLAAFRGTMRAFWSNWPQADPPSRRGVPSHALSEDE